MDYMIYCAVNKERNLVKIGFSEDPQRRVKQFPHSYGVTAELVTAIKGSKNQERLIHGMLNAAIGVQVLPPSDEWYALDQIEKMSKGDLQRLINLTRGMWVMLCMIGAEGHLTLAEAREIAAIVWQ
jgi:hypothetical protein